MVLSFKIGTRGCIKLITPELGQKNLQQFQIYQLPLPANMPPINSYHFPVKETINVLQDLGIVLNSQVEYY
jgi:hypothetical protein